MQFLDDIVSNHSFKTNYEGYYYVENWDDQLPKLLFTKMLLTIVKLWKRSSDNFIITELYYYLQSWIWHMQIKACIKTPSLFLNWYISKCSQLYFFWLFQVRTCFGTLVRKSTLLTPLTAWFRNDGSCCCYC